MSKAKLPSVMYEMLRSFVMVAETLNISKADKKLGVTRQTVRRHLDDLEMITGKKFFLIKNRQYEITSDGREYLPFAIDILSSIEAWARGEMESKSGLQNICLRDEQSDFFYFAHQHPLNSVWDTGVPLLKNGLQSWISAEGKIENEALETIKPYLLIFRKNRENWLCTFVGEHSSYASWLGLTWAKSAVGKALEDDAANPRDTPYVIEAYDSVFKDGCPRYDHVYAPFSRIENGESVPVSFQRLLFPCTLPDGDSVLGILVARTNRISIQGLNPNEYVPTPDSELMEFNL